MNKPKPYIFILIAFTILSSCSGGKEIKNPPDVEDMVVLEKYTGLWFEIARLPNQFQEGCYATTASYEILNNGKIQVTNTCRQDSLMGKIKDATGTAEVVEGSNNAKLKVSFFWPFEGDYWILHTGPDAGKDMYLYSLVGTPDREYLWILSRGPMLDEGKIDTLMHIAADRGYDTSKVIFPAQFIE